MSGSYAEWPSLFLFNADVQWVSGSHAEWPSLLYCSMFDVQWVLGGPAEWSSPFSIVQCLMFKGSRVVSRMAILFFVQCLMFNGCRAVMPNGHLFFIVQC